MFHRMLSVILVFALAAVSTFGSGRGIHADSGGTVIYLDGAGDNSQDGTSEDQAVATFAKAKKLVGDKGTIRVCGTVNVSGSESWSLSSSVKLKRAYGFDGAVAHVTGSLELSGISLYNTDISGSGSVTGLAGRSPASDIRVPSTVTLVQPKALSEVSLSDQCFGTGSFAWADGSFVPGKYETQAQIIFTPSDTDVHDYSGLKGWNGDSQTVIRSVKVLTQSFLEVEKDSSKDEEKKEESDKGDIADDKKEPETDGETAADQDKEETETNDKAEEDQNKDDRPEGEELPDADKDAVGGDGLSGENVGEEDEKADGQPGKEDGATDKEDEKADGEPGKEDGTVGGEDETADGKPGKEDQDTVGGEEGKPGSAEDTEAGDSGEDGSVKEPETGTGDDGTVVDGQEPNGTDGVSGEDKDKTTGQPIEETEKEETKEKWTTKKVEELLKKLPDTIASQADVDAVVYASGAFEQLDEEAQQQVSGDLLDRLYEAQSRVLGYNRVSMGVTVQGDLPWYVQFRASTVPGGLIDDSTIRTLLESYEFKLWNLATNSEYKLNGKTVTVLMAAPAVKDVNIVIYHYLEDGTVEQIIPEISGDQMSFATSSFSPFSVIGVSVAGSTELVGSTGYSYISGSKTNGSGNKNESNKNGNSSSKNSKNESGSTGSSSSTGGGTGSTASSSASNKNTSGSSSSASGNRNTSSSTGTRRAGAVGTGDSSNVLGYGMIGSGAVVLMLFAAYMIYVQYKRKSYSRRS